MQRVPNGPPPGATPAARLLQFKRLTKRFSARIQNGLDNRDQMRLMPTPICRYEGGQPGLIEGAVFGYTMGTNPDVLLVLELHRVKDGDNEWRCGAAGVARMLRVTRSLACAPPLSQGLQRALRCRYAEAIGRRSALALPSELQDGHRMPQHIGIVACSAEGAALCYRTICVEGAALLGRPHAHPEVSMHTPSLADTMAHIYRGIVPFVILQVLGLAAAIAFPELALWLPRKVGFLG